MKMKMCSREQKEGESLEDFTDDLIRLIGQGYPGNNAEGVTMAKDRIEFSARSAYVRIWLNSFVLGTLPSHDSVLVTEHGK